MTGNSICQVKCCKTIPAMTVPAPPKYCCFSCRKFNLPECANEGCGRKDSSERRRGWESLTNDPATICAEGKQAQTGECVHKHSCWEPAESKSGDSILREKLDIGFCKVCNGTAVEGQEYCFKHLPVMRVPEKPKAKCAHHSGCDKEPCHGSPFCADHSLLGKKPVEPLDARIAEVSPELLTEAEVEAERRKNSVTFRVAIPKGRRGLTTIGPDSMIS